MTPTFSTFFKSFYYSNTYLPAVDLSDQGLSKHLLESEDRETAQKAQALISNPEVQSVFSEPLSYDPKKVGENNEVLLRHGFKLLSLKPMGDQNMPYYSVVEHDNLPGWVIKSAAIRVLKDQLITGPANDKNEMAFFTEEESLLRIEMANRIAQVALKANIDVVIPKKKLVAYANLDGVTEANRKYCIVCEKINILSFEETCSAIQNMDAEKQKEIAKKISTIVQKAGLVDTSLFNIRLTPEGKLAFIDTEPVGLMVAKQPGLWNTFFGSKGTSVERCARIGLFHLKSQTAGFEAFNEQLTNDYKEISTPKLSKWKIGLSILSLGLIALINAVVAFVKSRQTKQIFEKLGLIDKTAQAETTTREYQLKPLEERTQFLKDYLKKRTVIAKQFFSCIEDVPYIEVPVVVPVVA